MKFSFCDKITICTPNIAGIMTRQGGSEPTLYNVNIHH